MQSENIFVYTLLTLPAPKYGWERFLVKKLLAKQIQPLIKRHDLKNLAIWTSLPTASELIEEFPNTPYIYYCGDDFSGLAGVDHKTAEFHENEIVKKSDLIIASSQLLLDKFTNEKCRYLSHGVDFDLFSNPTTKADDLPSNGKPTAGFYGSIAEWLDLDLLESVVKKMSNWNFVFIGDIQVDVSKLTRLNNTFFLGPKDHSELPRYCQHWQSSLLPFKNNAQIRACNPLKLKEYLATGTPVIATEFPAVLNYKNQISISRSHHDMCNQLQLIERERSVEKIEERKATVKNESWSAKADQLATWVDAL